MGPNDNRSGEAGQGPHTPPSDSSVLRMKSAERTKYSIIAERIGYGALNMVILAAFATAGDYNGADTNYRVARAMTYANMVGLGLISRDLVVVNATGWPLPMFTATVAQSLAVTYFAANEIGKTAVTIKKTTKSK